MYIVNPFRKKGLKASDLSSTHPPISERIRILRSMAGASFADYERAYSQQHKGGGSIIAPSAVAVGGAVLLREAEAKDEKTERLARTRQTSDLMWRVSNYKTITCNCGTKLRVPPGFIARNIKCPHCGRSNPI